MLPANRIDDPVFGNRAVAAMADDVLQFARSAVT
jgi:hypothetical protein